MDIVYEEKRVSNNQKLRDACINGGACAAFGASIGGSIGALFLNSGLGATIGAIVGGFFGFGWTMFS